MVRLDLDPNGFDVRSTTWHPLSQCAAYRRSDIWATDLVEYGQHYSASQMEIDNGQQAMKNNPSTSGSLYIQQNDSSNLFQNGDRFDSKNSGVRADSERDASMSDIDSCETPRSTCDNASWEQDGRFGGSTFAGGCSNPSTNDKNAIATFAPGCNPSLFGNGSIFHNGAQQFPHVVPHVNETQQFLSQPAFGVQKRINGVENQFAFKRMKF